MSMKISKENFLLDAIYEDAHRELNPSDEECPECGGEGYIADCFDGLCSNAEWGCEDCMRRCVECARHNGAIERYVRVQVLRAMDIGLARAWASRKNRGALAAKMSDREVLANLHAGRVGCKDFTDQERADSAAWVECLL
jgi:hypothetical protein